VKFLDGTSYATPVEVVGSDDVVVGRLRSDEAHPGAYLAWLVCDNLRKGAATNAVQIAEAALSADIGARA
ncbi:MAG TPA: Asd/ArgC dimerization domain-containing protein, partial [Candidatus Eremiobacteraceae bacterium]|nr:Asd/ArgC dimerization domain-containing protein [Candidatus Eremiobacteraceae bacterium]